MQDGCCSAQQATLRAGAAVPQQNESVGGPTQDHRQEAGGTGEGGDGDGHGGSGSHGAGTIGIQPPGSPTGVVVSPDGKKVYDPTISCGSEDVLRQRSAQYALLVKPMMSSSSAVILTMDDENRQKFQRLGPFDSDLQMMPVGACHSPNDHGGQSGPTTGM